MIAETDQTMLSLMKALTCFLLDNSQRDVKVLEKSATATTTLGGSSSGGGEPGLHAIEIPNTSPGTYSNCCKFDPRDLHAVLAAVILAGTGCPVKDALVHAKDILDSVESSDKPADPDPDPDPDLAPIGSTDW